MTSPTETAMAWREALAAMRPTGEPCPSISTADCPPMRKHGLDYP